MTITDMAGCVCVIDDDAEVRGAIGSLLRSHGFEIQLYDTTTAFLVAGAPARTSCLVLDIRLSGESGLDFQDKMAGHAIAMPVVLITGHGDIPMTVRGMRAGAIDVLAKPFDDDQLLAAIARALQSDAARRAQMNAEADLHAGFAQLTPREKEVMALVVTGLMNKQIAAKLALSEITVKIHRGNLMRKMAAQSLPDLVRMAEQLGIRDQAIRRHHPSV